MISFFVLQQLSCAVNIGNVSAPKLIVIANNQSPDNVYVQSISWNGVELPQSAVSVRYSDIMKGGELVFEMGSKPASV